MTTRDELMEVIYKEIGVDKIWLEDAEVERIADAILDHFCVLNQHRYVKENGYVDSTCLNGCGRTRSEQEEK